MCVLFQKEYFLYNKIDISKLSRDFTVFPLKKSGKYNKLEDLLEQDLQYLYIELNLSIKDIASFYNTSIYFILKNFKRLQIKKPKELIQKLKEETNIKKYGVPSPLANKQILEKHKQTCLKKYGVSNISQVKKFREKAIQTNIKKYGSPYYTQTKKFLERYKQTCLKKYGRDNFFSGEEGKEIVKNKFLEKYGVENPFQSEEIKEKIKQTNLKKYGKEYFTQTDDFITKTKKTNLEKYGCEYITQSEEIKEKTKQTNLKKYGKEYFTQTDDFITKTKRTNNENYGVDWYSQSELRKSKYKNKEFVQIISNKQYHTKKNNNSFNISKQEDTIYELLSNKFPDVIRQYRSSLYPYNCDFYIPSIDLYIEYQGNWTHGDEPFDENNPNHIELLNKLKSKPQTRFSKSRQKEIPSYWSLAIKVWTEYDVKKRVIAKSNHLNYLEFFNMEQFIKWFNSI